MSRTCGTPECPPPTTIFGETHSAVASAEAPSAVPALKEVVVAATAVIYAAVIPPVNVVVPEPVNLASPVTSRAVVVALVEDALVENVDEKMLCAVHVNGSARFNHDCRIFPPICAHTSQDCVVQNCGVSVAYLACCTAPAPVAPKMVDEADSAAVASSTIPFTASVAFAAPAILTAFTYPTEANSAVDDA